MQLKQCSLEESPLLSQLCKWEQLKGTCMHVRDNFKGHYVSTLFANVVIILMPNSSCYTYTNVTILIIEIFPLYNPVGDVSRSRSFKDLKKHTFDNMSAYLARKEERIRDQKAKKSNQQVIVERDDQSKSENPDSKDKPSSDDSNHSIGQSIRETGDNVLINVQPPEKKMKSDDTSTS